MNFMEIYTDGYSEARVWSKNGIKIKSVLIIRIYYSKSVAIVM
jgi:hypothetical protein